MTSALYPTGRKAGGGRGKEGPAGGDPAEPAVGRAGAGPMEREQFGNAKLGTAGGAATVTTEGIGEGASDEFLAR
ncbi:hypothetical protein BHE74_00047577 [Ensete ventricosum]|nr:hypothetical protein BHE74_00047577 [Ensete ventricosum]